MGKYVDLSQTVTASYYDEEHEEWRFKQRTIEDLLDDLCDSYTTTDAVPLKHGRWKRKIVDCGFNADWVCSLCGHKVMTDFVSYKYCPDCGALMDEKE